MNPQKLNRAARRCVALCVCLSVLIVSSPAQSPAQSEAAAISAAPKSEAQAISATPKTAASASAAISPVLFSWQVVPNIGDGYESSQFPQPVCAKVGAGFGIYVFTNYSSYSGETFSTLNSHNNIRVGRILTSNDSYQLLPDKLPGQQWREFAAAGLIKAGDTDSTIYLFGGRKGTAGVETDEVYSFKTNAAGGAFAPVANPIKTAYPFWGNRAGALAVPANGKIYLFGGYQGGTVLKQVQEFDTATDTFRILPASSDMPVGLVNARGMAKMAPGGLVYLYLVGGSTVPTTSNAVPNQNIYRFLVPNAAYPNGVWATVKNTAGTADLTVPAGSGAPMTTWDRSGNVRVIAAGGAGPHQTWANMQAWVLTDNYNNAPNISRASLSAAPYTNAARARDNGSAVKCGDVTYLIGGTYGKAGSTLQYKGNFIDKLVRLW